MRIIDKDYGKEKDIEKEPRKVGNLPSGWYFERNGFPYIKIDSSIGYRAEIPNFPLDMTPVFCLSTSEISFWRGNTVIKTFCPEPSFILKTEEKIKLKDLAPSLCFRKRKRDDFPSYYMVAHPFYEMYGKEYNFLFDKVPAVDLSTGDLIFIDKNANESVEKVKYERINCLIQ